jgi:hypothetical protein
VDLVGDSQEEVVNGAYSGGAHFESSPHEGSMFMFDIWTEREERVTLCLWRAYVLVLMKIKLCYTD